MKIDWKKACIVPMLLVLKSKVRKAKMNKQEFIEAVAAYVKKYAAVMGEVNWIMVTSAAGLAGVLSILTSVAGLPEIKEEN